MTEEEKEKLKAIEYLENFKDCSQCKHRWGDCANKLDEDCLLNGCYWATPTEQAIYLAGLHEGQPKWHKVADKIPMNEGWVCNQYGIPCWYDLEHEQWLDCEGTTLRVTEWCDMPYKE